MKKILIACDSFKDALSAEGVCRAIGRGLVAADGRLVPRILPLGDGGEGTVEVLGRHYGARKIVTLVKDPLFRPVEAFYYVADESRTAFIEMAAASGLQLLDPEERNPMLMSTYGTGELIRHAIEQGVTSIVLCIGGSATNDVGIGMAEALGFRFLDDADQVLPPVGGSLKSVSIIRLPKRSIIGMDLTVKVLCDVDNPLDGPDGAAFVFARQKGADLRMMEQLDEGLRHFGAVLEKHFGREFQSVPGAGAAGGLGAGAMAFLNAQLVKGTKTVLELVDFENQLRDCDLVITGEGKIDGQTARGKLIHGICQMARKYHKPVVGICGTLEGSTEDLEVLGLTSAFSILKKPSDLPTAISATESNLASLAYNLGKMMVGL